MPFRNISYLFVLSESLSVYMNSIGNAVGGSKGDIIVVKRMHPKMAIFHVRMIVQIFYRPNISPQPHPIYWFDIKVILEMSSSKKKTRMAKLGSK